MNLKKQTINYGDIIKIFDDINDYTIVLSLRKIDETNRHSIRNFYKEYKNELSPIINWDYFIALLTQLCSLLKDCDDNNGNVSMTYDFLDQSLCFMIAQNNSKFCIIIDEDNFYKMFMTDMNEEETKIENQVNPSYSFVENYEGFLGFYEAYKDKYKDK